MELFITGLVVAAAVFVQRFRKKDDRLIRQLAVFVFGMILLLLSVVPAILYVIKVDNAAKYLPDSGWICVEMSIDEGFYTESMFGKTLTDPYSYIVLEGKKYRGLGRANKEKLWVETNKVYTIEIGAGYKGSSYPHGGSSGEIACEVRLSPNDLDNGQSITVEVPLSGYEYAEVTVTFKRIYTFWEVVFS